MLSTNRPRARDLLHLVEEYASRSPNRSTAYQRVATETRVSVAALRTAACREGKKKPRRSLKCAFSDKEEELLEAFCVMHARQGTPLTYDEFIDMATTFGKRDEEHRFSPKFVAGFIKRHGTVLHSDRGKITSPARCLGTTQEKTKEFIDMIGAEIL